MGRTPSSRASLSVILSVLLLAVPCCARKSAAWCDPSPRNTARLKADRLVISEDVLQGELYLPRLVRRARHPAAGRRIDLRVRRAEIDRVQHVERFSPEFERCCAFPAEPLEERRVYVPLTIRSEDATSGVA